MFPLKTMQRYVTFSHRNDHTPSQDMPKHPSAPFSSNKHLPPHPIPPAPALPIRTNGQMDALGLLQAQPASSRCLPRPTGPHLASGWRATPVQGSPGATINLGPRPDTTLWSGGGSNSPPPGLALKQKLWKLGVGVRLLSADIRGHVEIGLLISPHCGSLEPR